MNHKTNYSMSWNKVICEQYKQTYFSGFSGCGLYVNLSSTETIFVNVIYRWKNRQLLSVKIQYVQFHTVLPESEQIIIQYVNIVIKMNPWVCNR